MFSDKVALSTRLGILKTPLRASFDTVPFISTPCECKGEVLSKKLNEKCKANPESDNLLLLDPLELDRAELSGESLVDPMESRVLPQKSEDTAFESPCEWLLPKPELLVDTL